MFYFQQIAVSLNVYQFLEDLSTIDRRSCSVAIDLASNQIQRIPAAQAMGLYQQLVFYGKITRFKMQTQLEVMLFLKRKKEKKR